LAGAGDYCPPPDFRVYDQLEMLASDAQERPSPVGFLRTTGVMKPFLKENGSDRVLRAQTLTVSFKKPFDLLAETTVAAQLAASEFERNSRWWRRRELNSTGKKNNFS